MDPHPIACQSLPVPKGSFHTKWCRKRLFPSHPILLKPNPGHHSGHFGCADTSFVLSPLPRDLSAHSRLPHSLMLCFFSFKYSWEQSGLGYLMEQHYPWNSKQECACCQCFKNFSQILNPLGLRYFPNF